jgi:hypothetical protein
MMLIRPRRLLAVLVIVAALAAIVQAAGAAGARAASVPRALSYLHAHQTKAGGFSGSRQLQAWVTPWCVLAIRAAGQSPASWHKSGGKSPIQYLQSVDLQAVATGNTSQAGNAANYYSLLITAYKAAGQTSLITTAGSKHVNLVAQLLAYQKSDGRFSANSADVNTTAWAIMALRASGSATAARARAVAWLQKQASGNGGFSYKQGGSPDADDTAAVVQALRAGGVSSTSAVIRHALLFLRSQQLSNGGMAYAFGASATAESTAWTVQAVVATGGNPAGSSWKKGGHTLTGYLNGMQASSGAFYHAGRLLATPLLTTSQAIVALKRRPYPL